MNEQQSEMVLGLTAVLFANLLIYASPSAKSACLMELRKMIGEADDGPAKTALFQVWNAVKGYAQEEYDAFMMEAAAAALAAARPAGEA
jgi:hypothetical protein